MNFPPVCKIIVAVVLATVLGGWLGSQAVQAQVPDYEPCWKYTGCCQAYCTVRYTYACVTIVCQVEVCTYQPPGCTLEWGNWYTDSCVPPGEPACSNPMYFYCPLICA